MGRDFKGVYHLIENRIYLYQPGHGSELIADKIIEGLDNPELDAVDW
jgi:peptide chain release factor 3